MLETKVAVLFHFIASSIYYTVNSLETNIKHSALMNASIAQSECFGDLFAFVHKQKIHQKGKTNNQHIFYKTSRKLATPNPELLQQIIISELELQ